MMLLARKNMDMRHLEPHFHMEHFNIKNFALSGINKKLINNSPRSLSI